MSELGQQGGWQPPPQQMGPGGAKTDPLAIASLIAGIVSFLACGCCSFVPLIGIVGQVVSAVIAVGAIVCGVISLKNIQRDPSLGGKPLAMTGTIIGGVSLLLIIIVTILILVGVGMSALNPPPNSSY